jgi:D-sedoheptulose 7-phosphate isomerase
MRDLLGLTESIEEEINQSAAVKKGLAREGTPNIARAAIYLIDGLRAGHKVLAVGNGGSAADAQHFVAELVGRYLIERKGLKAMALTTNASILTAVGNDFGFEEIFARQLEAVGEPGDVVVAISTGGNSANILRGVEFARNAGMITIGLTGRTGGRLRELVDVCVSVPSDLTPRIQEAHILIIHILCGIVERAFPSGPTVLTNAVPLT